MRIDSWIEKRSEAGTLANVARRVLEKDAKYKDVERTLQNFYVLEALIRHDGNQRRTAEAIGVSHMTVHRVLSGMQLTAADVKQLSRRLQGEANA